MSKTKVYKFWIPTTSSVGTSRYRLFVEKAEYDRVVKELGKLKGK